MVMVVPAPPNTPAPVNPVQPRDKNVPRGIRNSNPGNIDKTKPRTPWRGLLPDDEYPQSYEARVNGGRFEVFISPEWGVRALVVVLLTYQNKHGLKSVRQMIDRWAPPVENNTTAYVRAVANKLGVGENDPINLQDVNVTRPLVEAIIAHENNGYRYPSNIIREGLRLAGIEDAQPVSKTPAVKAAKATATPVLVGGGATVAVTLLEQAAPHIGTVRALADLIQDNGMWVAIVLMLLAAAGLAYAWTKRSNQREATGT